MPGLFRGSSNHRQGSGRTFRVGAGGVERGAEEMDPAEFGLLMGVDRHEGGQEPLLADDWVSSAEGY